MTEREWVAWDMYFCSIAGISFHPGAGKDLGDGRAEQRTVADCAKLADDMILERRKRMQQDDLDRRAA